MKFKYIQQHGFNTKDIYGKGKKPDRKGQILYDST